MATYSIPGFSEPFSSLSHLLGAGIFAVLGIVLLRRGRGSTSRLVTLGIFVVCCVFLLSMSGVYHLLTPAGVGHDPLAPLRYRAGQAADL
jgi:predicted membrane channel-forming protein YqfA (hemolysin III family)